MPWTHETPTRVRFKTLIDEGYSIRHTTEKLGLAYSTARYFLRRPDRQIKPPGRKPKISAEKVQEIVNWFTGYYDRRSLSLRQIREHFYLECYDNTLLAAFGRHGYHYHTPNYKPFISKANKLKRAIYGRNDYSNRFTSKEENTTATWRTKKTRLYSVYLSV
ncbi:hypothetical protein BJ875DRAFT_135611 [Amylocarpus encephaloides]|uniref:Transposase n=1 Tax=Amylocarpus encephaloides TaxID=45428 RepID=A0A9P8C230_9HELO|nr:hypothetical protein BJ875DRAFT_135611 [Amylocarpus encephaloides]